MSTVLVSARVPVSKREQAARVLRSLGATTTDLINTAFDYVIANGSLPETARPRRRTAAEFDEFVAATTLDVAWPETGLDDDPYYKEAIRAGKAADYEALA